MFNTFEINNAKVTFVFSYGISGEQKENYTLQDSFFNLSNLKSQSYEALLFTECTAPLKVEYGEKTFLVGKNDIVFLPRERKKYIISLTEKPEVCNFSLINVFFEAKGDLYFEAFKVNCSSTPELRSDFLDINKAWELRQPNYSCACCAKLYSIFSKTIELCESRYISPEQYKLIAKGAQYIFDNCFEKEFNFNSLEQLIDISYSYFFKLFKLRYGANPSEFVINMRMNKACDLLSSGICTVSQISELVGYEDSAYFSRLFKKRMGVSPLHYSQKYKK